MNKRLIRTRILSYLENSGVRPMKRVIVFKSLLLEINHGTCPVIAQMNWDNDVVFLKDVNLENDKHQYTTNDGPTNMHGTFALFVHLLTDWYPCLVSVG